MLTASHTSHILLLEVSLPSVSTLFNSLPSLAGRKAFPLQAPCRLHTSLCLPRNLSLKYGFFKQVSPQASGSAPLLTAVGLSVWGNLAYIVSAATQPDSRTGINPEGAGLSLSAPTCAGWPRRPTHLPTMCLSKLFLLKA